MVGASHFSDSDSMADAFEAMDIESSSSSDHANSEAASSSSMDCEHPLYYLKAEICKDFIEYYCTKYRRMFGERCVPNTTDPWQGISCSTADIDELFHRVTCYVGMLLDDRYNHTDPNRQFNYRVTKETLFDWMDLLTQRSHHELKISGFGGECIIANDPWTGNWSLYKRLNDWVEIQAAEHGLSDASLAPSPRCAADEDDEDYHQPTEDDNDDDSASVISQDFSDSD